MLSRPALYRAGFAVWCVFLFAYGTFSTGGGGPDFPHADKLVHFVYYAAGAACLALALGIGSGSLTTAQAVLAVALVTAVGFGDEFYQSFFPHRSGNDPGDLAADFAGALAGVGIARRLLPVLGRPRARPVLTAPRMPDQG